MSPATSNWAAPLAAARWSLMAGAAVLSLLFASCAKKAPPAAITPLNLSKKTAAPSEVRKTEATETSASANASADSDTGNDKGETTNEKGAGASTTATDSSASKPEEKESKNQSSTEKEVGSSEQPAPRQNSSESSNSPPIIEGRGEFRPTMPLTDAKGLAAEKLSQAKRAMAVGDLESAAAAASEAFNAAIGYSAVDTECGRIARAAEDLLGRAAAKQSPAQEVPTVFE